MQGLVTSVSPLGLAHLICWQKAKGETILEKLKRDESTRNIAKDLQVSQSWVAQFCKQYLSKFNDVNHNFGGKPQVYSTIDHRAYVRGITIGGLETAHKVENYLREEFHVSMSDNFVTRML